MNTRKQTPADTAAPAEDSTPVDTRTHEQIRADERIASLAILRDEAVRFGNALAAVCTLAARNPFDDIGRDLAALPPLPPSPELRAAARLLVVVRCNAPDLSPNIASDLAKAISA